MKTKIETDQLLTFEKKQPDETRLLLVDGHNLLFQMFFGFPTKIKNENGKVVSGTLGFISTILKVIKNLEITHCLVVFDKQQHLNNKDLSTDYKANRPDWELVEDDENPFTQIEDIKKALDFLNIKHTLSNHGFEADDYISTYITKCQNIYSKLFVLSKDTDFYQIVNEKVFIINYSGKNTKILSQSSIYEKLGIYPKHYIFFKALTGDTADNIKGVDGIGKVTAKKLIEQHSNLNQLFKNFNALPKQMQNKLEGKEALLELNQTLIGFKNSSQIETISNKLLKVESFESTNGYQVLKQAKIL